VVGEYVFQKPKKREKKLSRTTKFEVQEGKVFEIRIMLQLFQLNIFDDNRSDKREELCLFRQDEDTSHTCCTSN
jgi:hypothetical protein